MTMNAGNIGQNSAVSKVVSMERLAGSGGGEGSSSAPQDGGAATAQSAAAAAAPQPQGGQQGMGNLEYLKNLTAAMAPQAEGAAGGSAGALTNNNAQGPQGPGTNNGGGVVSNMNFLQMRDNAHDAETVASSVNPRRVSMRDSILSRESLGDMLGADQLTAQNLAMMNVLGAQGGMAGGQFGTTPQAQALNQSMSQLMMNSSLGGLGSLMANSGALGAYGPAGAASTNAHGGAFGMSVGGGDAGNPLAIPIKKSKTKHKQTFAQKLMHILSIKECQGAIRWMPNGCAFCVVDSKELVEKVLPKYFKEAKYTSFVSTPLVCNCSRGVLFIFVACPGFVQSDC